MKRTTMAEQPIPVPDPTDALNSINDGVYIVDLTRKITYWGRSAERITGWSAREVVGKHCFDNLLCHYDKDGHHLCGGNHCPLHRAMVTEQGSGQPIHVFIQRKDGKEVLLQVSVAPVRDRGGRITGGVETFRDLTDEYKDFQRVKKIQSLALRPDLPEEAPVGVRSHYIPCELLGGDYYAVGRLDENLYGFLVGDVTGHGVAAALYTMYLSSLWRRHAPLLQHPSAFADVVNRELCELIQEAEPFAACVCGVLDVGEREVRLVGAGNPPPLLVRNEGEMEELYCSGLPFGLEPEMRYQEVSSPLRRGDRVLLFTDGAVEVQIAPRTFLNLEGLIDVLQSLEYPSKEVSFVDIEKELLQRSDRIRFSDDVTFLELHYRRR